MRGLGRHAVVTIAALGMVSASATASPQARFDEAQAVFEAAQRQLADAQRDQVEVRRQFHESALRFADLADDVTSPNLCVNTGNAYHFAGENPRALLWYLRADRFAGTEKTRSGLASLRRVCGVDLWPRPEASIGQILMSWHYDLSRPVKQILLLTFYPLGCILVTVSLFARRRATWRRLGVTLIVMGSVIGISDVVTATVSADRWAVVLEPAEGHAGDGSGYPIVADAITPGQEVKVVESRPDWIKVELPSGKAFWIPSKTCETL